MDAILLKSGTPYYEDDYSAGPTDVRAGKKFLGKGSDELQNGAMPVVGYAEKKLAINEVYEIRPGCHDGIDKIYQEIAEQGAMTVTPNVTGKTIEVAGKYMKGNVTVSAVENFRPELIKKGVTIGEGDNAITGTFEGFV